MPPMASVERRDDVFVIHLANGENRWNTTFVREIAAALDDVEAAGGGVDGKGPAALAFCSDDPKFFSNGLDLAWMTAKDRDEQEALGGPWKPFNPEVMALFARIMTNPIPTLAAVGGHCFGAGMMLALCCDAIFMREDRGNMCANEVELGFAIPEPELALFRHKLPIHAFYETVMLAKRWSGPEALSAGIVQQICPADALLDEAVAEAQRMAKRLTRNRKAFAWQKEHIYGEHAAIQGSHGPAYMLRNPGEFAFGPGSPPANPKL